MGRRGKGNFYKVGIVRGDMKKVWFFILGIFLILLGFLFVNFENLLGNKTKSIALVIIIGGLVLINLRTSWAEKRVWVKYGLIGGVVLSIVGFVFASVIVFVPIDMLWGSEADMIITPMIGIAHFIFNRNFYSHNLIYFLALTIQNLLLGFIVGGFVGGVVDSVRKFRKVSQTSAVPVKAPTNPVVAQVK